LHWQTCRSSNRFPQMIEKSCRLLLSRRAREPSASPSHLLYSEAKSHHQLIRDPHSQGSDCRKLSDEMHRTHAHNGVSAYHRMIVKDHLEVAEHHHDALGDLHVCSGGHWVAGRMIVR
jgi:hypothetical protein